MLTQIPCPVCRKLFLPKSNGRGKPPTKTCSFSCGQLFRRGRSTARRRTPERWGRERDCPTCGKTFRNPNNKVVCCSITCARKRDWARGLRAPAAPTLEQNCGYIWRMVPSDHPCGVIVGARDSARRYVLEHRVVMEEQLGRYLDPRERVHHKNGIRDDNRPENLELWTLDHKDPAGVRVSDMQHCPTCTCNSP